MNISAWTSFEVATLFIVLTVLELPSIRLLVAIRAKASSVVVFRRKKAVLTLYALLSYFFLVGFWVDLMTAPFGVYTNIVFVRFFSAHWVTLAALLVVVTVIGLFDIVKGIYAALFIGAWHEAIWILSFADAVNSPLGVLGYYAPSLLMLGAMLASYYAAGFKVLGRRQEFLVVLSMMAFDVVWLWIGFPVTVANYLGQPNTVYFGSLFVNGVENWSWIVPCATACVAAIVSFILGARERHGGLSTQASIEIK